MHRNLILLAAGLVAGAMNAAAGGGSFVTVPALIWMGVPSVSANMSSTVALYPGSITSAWAYRQYFQPIREASVPYLFAVTLAGGFAGAMLLMLTPSTSFDKMIPWLLLVGSLAFAFGPKIGARLQKYYQPQAGVLLTAQFLLGIYGGYFGGAVGIMMMSVWSILGVQDIKAMNAIKVVLVCAANTIAVLCFVVAGHIAWHDTVVMLLAAAAGGYIGARAALLFRASQLRAGISTVNFMITLAFFYEKFFR